MNVKSRMEKLERVRFADEGRVRFRVIVPPKMTCEEWTDRAREYQRTGVFTVNLTDAEADHE